MRLRRCRGGEVFVGSVGRSVERLAKCRCRCRCKRSGSGSRRIFGRNDWSLRLKKCLTGRGRDQLVRVFPRVSVTVGRSDRETLFIHWRGL